jgi:two-component system, OmpR family, response regulator
MNTSTLERILLVEDESDIQMLASMTLEDLGGFTVEVAGSALEALTKASAFRPDLVLLDYMLPDFDGLETLASLRRMPGLEATPVVFMTARAQNREVEEYRQSGAIDVILKPFDAMTLADRVHEIWSRYQAGRAGPG